MLNALLWIALVGMLLVTGAAMAEGKAAMERPIVGATRWDAWEGGNEWERNLAPKQWQERLPFYSKIAPDGQVTVCGNTQKVMDREIAYAHAAGLDYWAYCYGIRDQQDPLKGAYGLRRHLASKHRNDMNFALLLMGQGFWGPKEDFAKAIDIYVNFFREPNYQKVLGGRPLLYVFYVERMPEYFGSEAAAKEALALLRRKSVAAGLKPPYIVAQVWSAALGAEYIDKMGFDAISAYAWADFSQGTQGYPYADLAKANKSFWESCKATGKQVIPLVSAGWDNRPRRANAKRYEEIYKAPPSGPWYVQPTPAELAANLNSALQWNRDNPAAAEANVVHIYAWNESDEGGWLVPTLSEGKARLDALRKILRPAGE